MKIDEGTSIQIIMTRLNRNPTLFHTVSLLLAFGCSSRVEVASPGTGGNAGTEAPLGGVTSTDTVPPTGGAGNQGGSLAAPNGGTTWVAWTDVSAGGTTWQNTWTGAGGTTWVDTWTGAGGTWVHTWTGVGGASWQNTWTGAGGGSDIGGSSAAIAGYSSTSVRVCTPGADQTCNDAIDVSSLMGHCESDGSCTCGSGYVINPRSGKCTTYDQTVCYSPTQNIDLAYVARAFGCRCDPNTAAPFCGIDSNGLRVYLDCQAFDQSWHSASTTYCSGSKPVACFSPTRNVEAALDDPIAIGCPCYQSGARQCVPLAPVLDAGPNDVFDQDASTSTSVEMICNLGGRWELFSWNCR